LSAFNIFILGFKEAMSKLTPSTALLNFSSGSSEIISGPTEDEKKTAYEAWTGGNIEVLPPREHPV
jgi:hypothetical protein